MSNMAKTQATKKQPMKSGNASHTDTTKPGMSKIVEEDEQKLLDEDINSGFGNYLRSQEGLYAIHMYWI